MAIVSFNAPGYSGTFSTMYSGTEIMFTPGDNVISDEAADYFESLKPEDWGPRQFMMFKTEAPPPPIELEETDRGSTPPPPQTSPDHIELIPDLDELTADEAIEAIEAVQDPTIIDLLREQETNGKKRKTVLKALEAWGVN